MDVNKFRAQTMQLPKEQTYVKTRDCIIRKHNQYSTNSHVILSGTDNEEEKEFKCIQSSLTKKQRISTWITRNSNPKVVVVFGTDMLDLRYRRHTISSSSASTRTLLTDQLQGTFIQSMQLLGNPFLPNQVHRRSLPRPERTYPGREGGRRGEPGYSERRWT